MKSRSNCSNEDEKQAFEAKTYIDIKILFNGDVLWPVFTETELQINRKTFKKWWGSKTQIYFWNQIFSEFITDLKFQQTALN